MLAQGMGMGGMGMGMGMMGGGKSSKKTFIFHPTIVCESQLAVLKGPFSDRKTDLCVGSVAVA
jgi:hypothetical protein